MPVHFGSVQELLPYQNLYEAECVNAVRLQVMVKDLMPADWKAPVIDHQLERKCLAKV